MPPCRKVRRFCMECVSKRAYWRVLSEADSTPRFGIEGPMPDTTDPAPAPFVPPASAPPTDDPVWGPSCFLVNEPRVSTRKLVDPRLEPLSTDRRRSDSFVR